MKTVWLILAVAIIVMVIAYMKVAKPNTNSAQAININVSEPLPSASSAPVLAPAPAPASGPAAPSASINKKTAQSMITPQSLESIAMADKEAGHQPAVEIVDPTGFINVSSTFKLSSLIGKHVVLLEFWTYSCINCVHTLPYITSWYQKYKDQGLVVVGVHTPEFAFEKDINNVQAAVQKYGIQYPVVLDNNMSTWNAYGNLYWPHEYLIDIAGYIVYDHIGEGAYDETEAVIQKLLQERALASK